MTTIEVDAVVIGAGINGLVAAAELGRGGWSVALVDGAGRIGGFIDSGERTAPGFTHDTYSSWHPLFVSGAAYAELGEALHAHGLEYANTEGPLTASAFVSGGERRLALAYRDADRTAAEFENPQDGAAYRTMLAELDERAPTIFGALGSDVRGRALLSLGWKALRRHRIAGSETLVREAVTSGRSYLRSRFTGPEADALWIPWLLHAGLGPDHASGGVMLPVFAASMHGFGLPIVRGGQANFLRAFEGVLADAGVHTVLGSPVTEILTSRGRASGVIAGDVRITARRAVLAGVSPQALYGELLPREQVPEPVRVQTARFRNGRAAMQVHLALRAPLDWWDPRLHDVPLVHLSDGAGSTGIACAQAEAGLLPAEPTVVVGQQCVLDPSRAPAAQATLWLQLQELPFTPLGDAAGELDVSGGWTPELENAYLDRVIARIERFAPGIAERIIAREIHSPVALAAANPNAVAGDPYGGSAELDQNLLWRPFPAGAAHDGVLPGLWHIGASTHPGPGLSGGSGHLVARRLLGRAAGRA